MKPRILNVLLILTSLMGYLAWGGNNHMFLFQAEADIILKLLSNPLAVAHPFILLPLAGQFVLLVTLFQKQPNKVFTYTGIGCLALLLGFMFVIGLLSLNYKIIGSTIPFLLVAALTIRHYSKAVK